MAIAMLFFGISCNKPKPPVHTYSPIITYKYQLFDSVEGHTNSTHYSLNRTIEFQYDPNVDKCYMPKNRSPEHQIDTFDRHHFWKRGYLNRMDNHHRIIFNGDTITIHHAVENQVGESGFRYTHGVRL